MITSVTYLLDSVCVYLTRLLARAASVREDTGDSPAVVSVTVTDARRRVITRTDAVTRAGLTLEVTTVTGVLTVTMVTRIPAL